MTGMENFGKTDLHFFLMPKLMMTSQVENGRPERNRNVVCPLGIEMRRRIKISKCTSVVSLQSLTPGFDKVVRVEKVSMEPVSLNR
jgi:hypothetical protein